MCCFGLTPQSIYFLSCSLPANTNSGSMLQKLFNVTVCLFEQSESQLPESPPNHNPAVIFRPLICWINYYCRCPEVRPRSPHAVLRAVTADNWHEAAEERSLLARSRQVPAPQHRPPPLLEIHNEDTSWHFWLCSVHLFKVMILWICWLIFFGIFALAYKVNPRTKGWFRFKKFLKI